MSDAFLCGQEVKPSTVPVCVAVPRQRDVTLMGGCSPKDCILERAVPAGPVAQRCQAGRAALPRRLQGDVQLGCAGTAAHPPAPSSQCPAGSVCRQSPQVPQPERCARSQPRCPGRCAGTLAQGHHRQLLLRHAPAFAPPACPPVRLCHPPAKGNLLPRPWVTACCCSTSCIIRTDSPCLEIAWKLEK